LRILNGFSGRGGGEKDTETRREGKEEQREEVIKRHLGWGR